MNEVVGRNIKYIRKHHNHSLTHLSIFTGLEKSGISRMENNKRSITIRELDLLSKFYNIPHLIFCIPVNESNYQEYIELVELSKCVELSLDDVWIIIGAIKNNNNNLS
ncbi:helix-turn-helix domain-containing protein [Aquibacillus saliphilus]|uniref:helix-turn-helix domain-containing protein n=1 Tax=Aquibacillus saliphilus TaxID=1909422 RepID=UPI001CF0CD6B|nr:helix-turn-helix transcriptional regulator [Aquibacillus saliphilus]